MGMQNFAAEFQTPEQYIIDITYKIWEQQGVGRIRDWYAADGPVRTPGGVSHSSEVVVHDTLVSQYTFPHRELLAEDVIIGDQGNGFYSSHRVRGVGMHLGDGLYGPATGRPVTTLAIADCVCRENRIVEEWVLSETAGILLQLGLDPVAIGRQTGAAQPEAYAIGNAAMVERWSSPGGFTTLGDSGVAQPVLDAYSAIWQEQNLHHLPEHYDRAARLEGPGGVVCFGLRRIADVYTSILAAIPGGSFAAHHVIVRAQPERPVRVALRWSYCGSHTGPGRYGPASGAPVALLGISHFELRDGRIVNEWLVLDETAVHAQIGAHSVA